MNLKQIVAKQIKDGYKGILDRKENGWGKNDLINFTAGLSNSLNDLVNDLHENKLLTDTEAKELEDVLYNTLDTLEF